MIVHSSIIKRVEHELARLQAIEAAATAYLPIVEHEIQMEWTKDLHIYRASGSVNGLAGVKYSVSVGERTHYRAGIWYADVRLYIHGNVRVWIAENNMCDSLEDAQTWSKTALDALVMAAGYSAEALERLRESVAHADIQMTSTGDTTHQEAIKG